MAQNPPPEFPQITLAAQRALTYIAQHNPDRLVACALALWRALFIDHKRIGDGKVALEAIAGVVGADAMPDIVAGSQKSEVKEQLTKMTGRAFEEGAFGVPWFVVTNARGESEGFWGVDHLGAVAEFAGLERLEVRSLL